MENVTLLILLALLQYIWFALRVGNARGKYGVSAPATTGDVKFESIFRVQQNTLEQLIIFIPAMLAFATYTSSKWALIPGAAFLIGRQLYAMEYTKDPKTRTLGFMITFIAEVVLVLGAIFGVVRVILA